MDQEYIKTVAQAKGMSPVCPFSPESQASGISYREWLIGQALGGLCQRSASNGFTAMTAIKLADEVLIQLAQEAIARQEEVQ